MLDDFFRDVETVTQDATFEVLSWDPAVFDGVTSAGPRLTIQGKANVNGTGKITVRAWDNGDGASPRLSADVTFQVTVVPVNTPPVLAGIPDLVVQHGDVDSPADQSVDLDDFFKTRRPTRPMRHSKS